MGACATVAAGFGCAGFACGLPRAGGRVIARYRIGTSIWRGASVGNRTDVSVAVTSAVMTQL